MTNPRLLLIAPRSPRADGQGDQRRAHVALTALAEDWDIEVVSWLPDAGEPLGRLVLARPACLLRAAALSTVCPLQVACVQALAPPTLRSRLRRGEVALFMTDRAVPRSPAGPFVIDFIDDLGGAAERRAASSRGPAAWFWRWEGGRLRRLDARLAAQARVAIAITERDAAAISPVVATLRAAMGDGGGDEPERGDKVVFTGNLFYQPNFEAAAWICDRLAPELARRGLGPGMVVIAGRRPPDSLRRQAATAGVDLRADVSDLGEVLREAAVVLAPVVLGSGVQNKVLDAVAAGRPCVITPFTNQVLGLEDGRSALIRDRSIDGFADAVMELLADPGLRNRLSRNARQHLAPHRAEAVGREWRRCLAQVRPDG